MMYKLCIYIPEQNLEEIKSALFEAGAGTCGNYDRCSWQTLGETQFRPLKGSRPATGKVDKLVQVEEYRLEMICADHTLVDVIQVLKILHPYENPAWDLVRLVDESQLISN